MKTEKSCGCIIIDENKVLLIGSKDDDENIFYGFPKGHQEQGETDIETALRETKEEVGLDVEILNTTPIKTGHFVHGGTVWKDIYLFIAKPLNFETEPQQDEVEEAIWVDFDEANEKLKGYYLDAWKIANKLV